IVYKSALVLSNNSSTVFDGDFLLRNETGNQSCNVDLAPAIRNCTVSALHIAHRCTQHLGVLQFEPLTDLVQSILVIGTQTGKSDSFSVCAIQYSKDVCVALNELVDHIELRIYALNQTVQSCI